MNDFIDPDKILNELELREEMQAADFGCGSGGWVIPLAKRLEQGKVYALDILEEPISALRSRIETAKLVNIEIIQSNIEAQNGSRLINDSLDLVLMTNLLFQLDSEKAVLEEAKRVLRPGGEILIVEWLSNSSLGPKGKRVSADRVKQLASGMGLRLKKEFGAGACHYGLVFVK
ncbi:class I SAM-dependent methyltransferase [Candidatus Parcubacteria bacterium]|nr:class I SAM-dependent methyltransferase [Candidatus Parcubacteria bacterium]